MTNTTASPIHSDGVYQLTIQAFPGVSYYSEMRNGQLINMHGKPLADQIAARFIVGPRIGDVPTDAADTNRPDGVYQLKVKAAPGVTKYMEVRSGALIGIYGEPFSAQTANEFIVGPRVGDVPATGHE